MRSLPHSEYDAKIEENGEQKSHQPSFFLQFWTLVNGLKESAVKNGNSNHFPHRIIIRMSGLRFIKHFLY